MAGNPQTIELNAGVGGEPQVKEALAASGSAINPGYLIEETTAGEVQEHSTAAANAQKLFAMTDLPVGGKISDAYAVGQTVRYGAFKTGQEVYALLAAAATAVTQGAALESAGDGTLRVLTTDAATDDTQRDSVVAYAIEAVDNSGGGTEARIRVRVA